MRGGQRKDIAERFSFPKGKLLLAAGCHGYLEFHHAAREKVITAGRTRPRSQ